MTRRYCRPVSEKPDEEIARAHAAAVAAGEPGYLDPVTGLFVFTAVALVAQRVEGAVTAPEIAAPDVHAALRFDAQPCPHVEARPQQELDRYPSGARGTAQPTTDAPHAGLSASGLLEHEPACDLDAI